MRPLDGPISWAGCADAPRGRSGSLDACGRCSVLRPGQDDHRGLERARVQPAVPAAGPDHAPGRAAQRLRAAAAPASRARTRPRWIGSAAAHHRPVRGLGRRAGPRDRGADAARDRRAARLRRGAGADRRAPGAGRRDRGAVGVGAGGRRADRRDDRRRPLPWPPAWRSRDGRYTGEIELLLLRRGRRRRRPATSPPSGATTWPDCRAYSDSITDLPLLSAVGYPTAVNPDRALRRVAAGARLAGADLRPAGRAAHASSAGRPRLRRARRRRRRSGCSAERSAPV